MALLSLQDISLKFADTQLLDAVSLQIEAGERVCLLGRNGAGKSTLLRLLSGEIAPDAGEIVAHSSTLVARLPQEVPSDVSGTTYEVIEGGGGAPHEIDALLSRLKLDGDTPFESLSGGLKRRAWLGRVLAGAPDVLLLDEPTNHLDIDSITWLEEFLVRYVKTLLFVSHDREFVRKLATRIVEVDRAQLLSWDCPYDTYLVRKEAALEAESKQRALFDKRLAQEEVWVRRGVEARRTKSLSRIRELVKMREERSERRERMGSVQMRVQDGNRSGHLVVEAENVSFSYGDRPIVRDFSTLILRGDKIGIIGPNGMGKTTLLRLLLGEIEPQSGTIKLGTRLEVAYFDQLRAQLDDEKSVQYNVCGEASNVEFNGQSIHIIGYLNQWLFSSERARTLVKFLSGGERNRLLLAKLFTQPANILVMDEPTNDLDAETLDLLENLLVEFKGTLLLVSHDRAFLNNVVTSSLVFETDANGETNLREYTGGYDDWLRQRPKLQVAAPPKPAAKPVQAAPKARKLSFKEARELEELPRAPGKSRSAPGRVGRADERTGFLSRRWQSRGLCDSGTGTNRNRFSGSLCAVGRVAGNRENGGSEDCLNESGNYNSSISTNKAITMASSENERDDFLATQHLTLRCLVCGCDNFSQRTAQLNTAVATFFNFDWTNASATCYVCENCGYIHWFLPTSVTEIRTKSEGQEDNNPSEDETQFVPPEAMGLIPKRNKFFP
jgi:ATP-binding cassette subfamily F protein uup